MKPSRVTHMVTMIFLIVFSSLICPRCCLQCASTDTLLFQNREAKAEGGSLSGGQGTTTFYTLCHQKDMKKPKIHWSKRTLRYILSAGSSCAWLVCKRSSTRECACLYSEGRRHLACAVTRQPAR